MIDRTKVWAGEMNARAAVEAPAAPARVGLYDTTLRDGEQTVGVVLDPERKLAIARELDALGIDRIEAGFPRVSEADHEAFAAIASAGLRAEVWGFSRAMPADLEALAELGVRAAVIEAPISDGKLAAYGLTREKVQQRIETAIHTAGEAGIKVAFFGVDGSRAAADFLQRIYSAAVQAGAVEVVAVDTIGVATPETAAHFVTQLRGWVGEGIPIHWHGHDDFGLATACSLAAVRAGATWVQGTINGMGERGGNADLVEIGMALEALYGIDTGLDFRRARRTSAFVREASGYQLEPWKAIVGENLFTRETGAVASQFHDPPAVEPFSAELVDAERRIVLGKKSGIDSIRIKLSELGLEAGEEQQRTLLAAVKELGARERRLVTDDELRALASDAAGAGN